MFHDNDVYKMMNCISHKMFMVGYAQVKEENIHPKQIPLMMKLKQNPGFTQRELAKEIGIQPSTLNVTIQRMEKNGLVIRKQDTKDQRRSLIYLSTQGEEVFGRMEGKFQSVKDQSLKHFSENEKKEFVRLLEKYSNALDDALEGGKDD